MNTSNKIQSIDQAIQTIQKWKENGEKIVFTNGCFDLVHIGHVEYLEKTRQLGDRLIVGLNTDQSVKNIKGKDRPIVEEHSRARVVAAFEFVDLVTFFEEDTPLQLIKAVKPDILTKGDDYSVENIVGASSVLENGGSVETIKLVEGFSTSNIIKKIIKIFNR